ncbi:MAG TPA: 3-isopropylmalate dehydratase small subunit [Thermoanaerobaculia bacterium]|jgi:3-isopropylmalate/(R)-2-methylmalate dehydratase small subunit|nr:3-isopropylmalate dehydratase small subunit [Thermoanaerobaculia bacterium]
MSDIPSFTTLRSKVAPLAIDNVDTDRIIPARYLKVTDKNGLGEGLFFDWRRRADGALDPDFVLHRPEHRGAAILLAGENFGCGSSREHAPWALLGAGFQAVLSTRFADIFRNNSLKNGLLVVEIPAAVSRALLAAVERDPTLEITIDLPSQKVLLPDGAEQPFTIEPFSKHCLLNGVDQLGFLLDQVPAVERFEAAHAARIDSRA